jgi:hypothetical protein
MPVPRTIRQKKVSAMDLHKTFFLKREKLFQSFTEGSGNQINRKEYFSREKTVKTTLADGGKIFLVIWFQSLFINIKIPA